MQITLDSLRWTDDALWSIFLENRDRRKNLHEDAMLLHDRLVNKYRAVSAAISWSCCLYELDWVERKRKPFYGLLLICLQIVIVPAGATKCNELKRFQG